MTIERRDAEIMAEAIGQTTLIYLRELLRAIHVEYYAADERAVVWIEPRNADLDLQLEAVSAFSEVRDCYRDELQLELRFGAPDSEQFASLVSARAVLTA
jgi:hypothetical protein